MQSAAQLSDTLFTGKQETVFFQLNALLECKNGSVSDLPAVLTMQNF